MLIAVLSLGVFAYKNHPITKVDVLGKIVEIEARGKKLFTYYGLSPPINTSCIYMYCYKKN